MKSEKVLLAKRVSELIASPAEEIAALIAYPPNQALGDLALPCFRFAKLLHKSPQQIADELANALRETGDYADIQTVNGYLNIHVRRDRFATALVKTASGDIHTLFSTKRGTGKRAAIDYSSPNIAKPFSVGHLRSTMIGQSIARLLQEDGLEVVRINHLGDWGTQFGKNITAFLRWGDEAAVKRDPVRELFHLYVRFHQEAAEHPELDDEARAWFKKLEDKDEEALRLWQWFIEESLKAFKQVYDLLGVTFDHYLGESFYNDKMDAVVDELRDRQLLVESEGAEVVDLSAQQMPPCIIRKSDGATIYATRDLAAALYRHDVLGATDLVYVVGAEQTLHFKQVFQVLNLMGREWADNCRHIAFGMMKYNGERLSTRRGKIVYLEDVLNRAIAEANTIIEAKNPALARRDEVAQAVGIGAVIFNDLKTHRMHDPDFRFEEVLNFDGETGPYVQYTHARACSVLRKAQEQGIEVVGGPEFQTVSEAEWQLVHQLSEANEIFERAVDEFDPSLIARYALDTCHAFNRFYHDDSILGAEPALRPQRLALTNVTRLALAHALYLLGLQAPEAM